MEDRIYLLIHYRLITFQLEFEFKAVDNWHINSKYLWSVLISNRVIDFTKIDNNKFSSFSYISIATRDIIDTFTTVNKLRVQAN